MCLDTGTSTHHLDASKLSNIANAMFKQNAQRLADLQEAEMTFRGRVIEIYQGTVEQIVLATISSTLASILPGKYVMIDERTFSGCLPTSVGVVTFHGTSNSGLDLERLFLEEIVRPYLATLGFEVTTECSTLKVMLPSTLTGEEPASGTVHEHKIETEPES